jgi:hypothetical protein
MFALDLFNTDHERRIAEGAVDQLEQRRIDDLAMKMDDLVARAKTPAYKKNPAALAALMKEFQKCKAERDSYYKVRNETMGYGSLGEADQVTPPTQPVRAGTDLVTPQQRVAGATPPSNTALGKAKETFTSFANWLAGKDDTGPTYESAVKEQTSAISPVTAAKYAYEQMRKAHDDNVDIATIRWMNNPEAITMSRNQLYHTLTRLKNMSRQNRNQFALQTLADRNNFALWLGGQKKVQTRPQLKATTDPFQTELPLGKPKSVAPVQERVQKKNSEDPKFGDAETANALRKIRAKHPATSSDLEALAKNELDYQARSDRQLAAIQGANTKQDALLKQLVSLDQEQGREIDGLDSENNNLEAQLARIQATNDRLQTTIQSMTGTKQSARTKQPTKTEPQTKTKTTGPAPATTVDLEVEKKIQGLEAQLNKLEQQPQSAEVKKQIADLENRINALPAKAAKALNIEPVNQVTPSKQAPRVQAPFSDLDIEPPKSKAKPKAKATSKAQPKATVNVDEPDLLDINEDSKKLHTGDPIVVTTPNEFEGKTGEIYDFSPSGTFVIVDLYNHGKHSMHLSDVEYNDYADQEEEDDWYDAKDTLKEVNVNPQFIDTQVTKILAGEARRMTNAPMAQLLAPVMKQYGLTLQQIDGMVPGGLKKAAASYGIMMKEGWSDAMVARRTGQPRTPYSVYINGKKWKDFENDDHAEAVANKLRAKFKAEGRDPSVITIAPTDMSEAISKKDLVGRLQKNLPKITDPKNKDARPVAWTGPGKDDYGYTGYQGHGMPTDKQERDRKAKDKGVVEAIVASGPSKPLDDRAVRKMVWDTMKINADTGEQALQRALAVLAKKPQSRMVQDLQDKFQSLADRLAQGVTEGAMSNLHADLVDVYNRMAPGIERNRDSFKAGQLYDALEAVAEQHGAEAEFKRMMNGARNRAHMDYDTNPGGFHNWFWYLPFADEDVAEGLMKEPTNRKEYLDQRDKLFRMMAVDSNPANKQIIKQALQDLEARYGNLKNAVKEESSTDSEAVERAILNRIMVAHTDLLMKFGPEKVMQAAEEVAYNVGDVDEIGTSDVSAYVHQVKQILGVPEEVNEKWSQKYKSSINCASPKGFSQKAHCAGRKK